LLLYSSKPSLGVYQLAGHFYFINSAHQVFWHHHHRAIKAVQILRVRRAPLSELVKRFRERGLLADIIHTCVEEKLLCFFMLSVITRGSELCTTPLEDP
jgi:hypothetical protein